jgi:glyoxylase-like metal-dependent hydrolase (beta-lactamase superfamily II)
MARRLYSLEGNRQKLDGGAMFGNAPKAVWSQWAHPDGDNRIDLACRALLVEDHGRWILFEAGIGAFFEPKLRERYGVVEAEHVLLGSLAAIGLSDADVDVVVLSHLHFDHAGGLLSAWSEGEPLRLLFPRATFLVSEVGWARAKAPHRRDRASFIPELPPLLEASGRLEIVAGDRSPTLGEGYRLRRSEGHTPGLMLAEIDGDVGPLVFASDLVPGRPWLRRALTMGYDRFPERLVEEKEQLLAELAARGGRVFFTHDPGCALARIALDERKEARALDPLPQLTGQAA